MKDELKAIAANNYKDEIKLRLKSAKLELKKRDHCLYDEGLDDYTDEKYKQENYKMGWSKDGPDTMDIAVQQGRDSRDKLPIVNETDQKEVGYLLQKLLTHLAIYCSGGIRMESEAILKASQKLIENLADQLVPGYTFEFPC